MEAIKRCAGKTGVAMRGRNIGFLRLGGSVVNFPLKRDRSRHRGEPQGTGQEKFNSITSRKKRSRKREKEVV